MLTMSEVLVLAAHLVIITLCVVLRPGSIESAIVSLLWLASLLGVLWICHGRKFVKALAWISMLLAYNAVVGAIFMWSCFSVGIRGCP